MNRTIFINHYIQNIWKKWLPEVINYLYLPKGHNFIIDRDGYEDIWFEEISE
ncbi:immunity protein Imm33 domain-containing protein [Proteus terrae]|uniref:immunity protein Imm33 domain-containing protein n=1 Tax=Proteus terrae TaxID=1574161 RepID=UPI003AFF80F6